MPPSIRLVLKFLWHIVIGAVLFFAVAVVSYALWIGTEWLQARGAPTHLYRGMFLVAELVFYLDVLCGVVFVIAEVWKLIREIIRGAWKGDDS